MKNHSWGENPEGIIPGDALSLLIAMIPLNRILNKCTDCYKLNTPQDQLPTVHGRHQTLPEMRQGLVTLMQVVRICNRNIGMGFGIEKCAMLLVKNWNWQMTKSRNNQNAWSKGNLQVLRNIGREHHQTSGGKRKKKKKKVCLRRTRKLLEIKLCRRNLTKLIQTWAVPLIRYSEPFLKWTREELQGMVQNRRKLVTMSHYNAEMI